MFGNIKDIEPEEPEMLDNEVLKLKTYTNEYGQEVWKDRNGFERVKGTTYLAKGQVMNPTGFKKRKQITNLQNYLSLRLGENGERACDLLIKIIEYDPEKDEKLFYKRQGEGKIKPTNVFKPKYTPEVQLRATELFFKQMQLTPPKQIEKKEDVNVNVTHNISKVAKLIQQNKQNLQLIEGGKDDIIDIEENN